LKNVSGGGILLGGLLGAAGYRASTTFLALQPRGSRLGVFYKAKKLQLSISTDNTNDFYVFNL
jgi:hypothetical protein